MKIGENTMRKKALVVEDDVNIAELLKIYLQKKKNIITFLKLMKIMILTML